MSSPNFSQTAKRLGISRHKVRNDYLKALKRKQMPERKVCLVDDHGVFNVIPLLFDNPNMEIIVITGSTNKIRGLIQKILDDHNLRAAQLYLPKKYMDLRHSPVFDTFRDWWKIQQVVKINPDFYFDDQENVIRRVQVLRDKGVVKTLPILVLSETKIYDGERASLTRWAQKKDAEAKVNRGDINVNSDS